MSPRLGPVPWSDPAFRRLWLGQAVSEVGDGVTGLALIITVHRLTGSLTAVGAVALASLLPQLILGVPAGAFVDRCDRRRIMVSSDVARAILLAALAAVLAFAPPAARLPAVLALAAAQACAAVFFEPARTAFLPTLVAPEALLAANSLTQSTRAVCGVAGAALAGALLVQPAWTPIAFLIDAATFLVSAVAILSVRPRVTRPHAPAVAATRRRAAEVFDGLRRLVREPEMRALAVGFGITVAGTGAVNVLFVPYLVGALGAPTHALGPVRAAQVIGMVTGGALLARVGARAPVRALLVVGLAGLGLCFVAIGSVSHWVAALPVLAMLGVCSSAVQSSSATLLQTAVPDGARGRAESALDTVLVAVMTLSTAASGPAGDRLGPRPVFVAAGVLAFLGAGSALLLLGRSRLLTGERPGGIATNLGESRVSPSTVSPERDAGVP